MQVAYRLREAYYRLVTQFEIPALPVAKSLGKGNGLEDGIAKIAAALEGERQQEEHENS